MATDFRAQRIRSNALIVSRSDAGNASFIIYSGSSATDSVGGISDDNIFDGVGTDVFLFVSGTTTGVPGSLPRGAKGGAVTLFGGDLIVSGTIYADRQVIEVDETITGSLTLSGSLFVSQSATINEGLTVNSSGEGGTENDFQVKGDAGNALIFGDVSENTVGIGTDSPLQELHIEKQNAGSIILLGRNDSSIIANEQFGYLFFGGTLDGTNYNQNAASIIGAADGGWSNVASDAPGKLIFYTTPASSATALPRMTIKGSGKVGVGIEDPLSMLQVEAATATDAHADLNDPGNYHLMLTTDDDTPGRGVGVGFKHSTVAGAIGGGLVFTDTGNNGIGTLSLYNKTSTTLADPPMEMLFVDGEGRAMLLSGSGDSYGTRNCDDDPKNPTDLSFYVSGSIGAHAAAAGPATTPLAGRGVGVFGGDLVVSGAFHVVSGSITYGSSPIMTSWNLDGDTGTAEPVGESNTVLIAGGAGIGTTVAATDTLTVAIDYLGTDNFIDIATDLEGTPIAADDTIVYHDDGDKNVKKGLVSDLPFSNTAGTVTSVATGTGLSGGPITSTGTINLANTAVTPATYGDANNVAQLTVDQQGRITGVTDVAISGGGGGSFWDQHTYTIGPSNYYVIHPKGYDVEHTYARDVLIGSGETIATADIFLGGTGNDTTNAKLLGGTAMFNMLNEEDGKFRVGTGPDVNTGKKSALLVDYKTGQVGILTAGPDASQAYGLNSKTDPIPSDVGLFVSGVIEGRHKDQNPHEMHGIACFGGDLHISGVLSVDHGASVNIHRAPGPESDFIVSSPFHTAKLMVQQSSDTVCINSDTPMPFGTNATDLYVSGAVTRWERIESNFKSYIQGFYKARVNSTEPLVRGSVQDGDNLGQTSYTPFDGTNYLYNAVLETAKMDNRGGGFDNDVKPGGRWRLQVREYLKDMVTTQAAIDVFSHGIIAIHSGGKADTPSSWFSPNEVYYTDTNFFVSGAIGGKDEPLYSKLPRGISMFGGDVAVSGSLRLECLDDHPMGAGSIEAGHIALYAAKIGENQCKLFFKVGTTETEIGGGGGAGTVTEVTVGTGLEVANGTTIPDIDLDFDALTKISDSVTLVGSDEMVVLDADAQAQKEKIIAFSNVKLGLFNNDLDLTDMADVSAASPNPNDVLTWDNNSSNWIPTAGGGGSGDLLQTFASGSTAGRSYSLEGPDLFALVRQTPEDHFVACPTWKADVEETEIFDDATAYGSAIILEPRGGGEPVQKPNGFGFRMDIPPNCTQVGFVITYNTKTAPGAGSKLDLRLAMRYFNPGYPPGLSTGQAAASTKFDWADSAASGGDPTSDGWQQFHHGGIDLPTNTNITTASSELLNTTHEIQIANIINSGDKPDFASALASTRTVDVMIVRASNDGQGGPTAIMTGEGPPVGLDTYSSNVMIYELKAFFS